jgi:GNAT superfamily N-acetyltransferase
MPNGSLGPVRCRGTATAAHAQRCFCQRYKLHPGESFANVGREELAARQREQTHCGAPGSGTSGLVAYLGDEVGWAITCVFARAGYRKRGIARALAAAAVEHARRHGARAVEAYPMVDKNALAEELHVGTEAMFADAGMTVVSHPSKRRLVMRRDL